MNVQYCWSFPVSQEDLALKTEIYFAIQICVSPTEEAARLFLWILPERQWDKFDNCAATMHNIQPLAGDNNKDMTYTRGWKIFTNFPEDLTQLASLDPPYLSIETLKQSTANKEQQTNNSFIV